MSASTLATVLAGIAFDPHIRGVLVMIVAVGVLIGGIWLILGTNMGSRLGFLVTLTGLCGWMFLMSVTWAAYGIGLVGELPSWTVKEINVGDLSEAETDEARDAPTADDLPEVASVLAANPEISESFDEGTTVRLGDLVDADENVVEPVNGWEVIGAAELGEPQTAADEALAADGAPQIGETGEYVVLNGFETGGKPERDGDGIFDRIAHKITSTLRVTHPTRYAIVQVQGSVPTDVPEGAAPLPPTADPDEPVVSVIMVRNLGNLRLPPVILTVVFGILFAVSAKALHERDKEVMAKQAESV